MIERYKSLRSSRHYDPGSYVNIAKRQAELDHAYVTSNFFLYETKAQVSSAKANDSYELVAKDIKELHSSYSFDKDVEEYLTEYPFVIQTLALAVGAIEREFDGEYSLSAEILDEGASRKLFAVITTTKPAEEALSSLDEFDRTWWFRIPSRVRNFLEFTVDFA